MEKFSIHPLIPTMSPQAFTHNYVSASYSQIACIGTGLSAIALGATLKRWYDMDDIHFFERHADCGGTWHISSYPGKSCLILAIGVLRLTDPFRMCLRRS